MEDGPADIAVLLELDVFRWCREMKRMAVMEVLRFQGAPLRIFWPCSFADRLKATIGAGGRESMSGDRAVCAAETAKPGSPPMEAVTR